MKWNPITRRHFLEGPGKAALILPFLPSLLPRSAKAQTTPRQKSFIGIPLFNGMFFSFNNDAAQAATTPSYYMPAYKNMQKAAVTSPYPIYTKTLTTAKADGNGRVSEIIDESF